jgi:alpha-beta hydrolase superfamily lysophospholipase
MKKLCLVLFLMFASLQAFAASEEVTIEREWGRLAATLAQPEGGSSTAVLIIAGSGPTDRNGNSGLGLVTYCYKMLSDELVKRGYAVLRYDKRGIAASMLNSGSPNDVLFGDMVDDAAACVAYLRDRGYERVVVAGHSEGGSIAQALEHREDIAVDGLVLLCAPGYAMDEILITQLSAQLMPSYMGLMITATNIINQLKRGVLVAEDRVPKELMSLFHPSVQPYLISSMQFIPVEVAARSSLPTFVVTGGRDVQVSVDNGERLVDAMKSVRHRNFEKMCHVLKDAPSSDRVEQLMSVYTNQNMPLTEGLADEISEFITNL